MAPVKSIRQGHEFRGRARFYAWLSRHHDSEDEVLDQDPQGRVGTEVNHPKGSHRRRALLGLDRCGAQIVGRTSYLQRYTPRGRKSIWSRINVDNVARLVEEGRMDQARAETGRTLPRRTGAGTAPIRARA